MEYLSYALQLERNQKVMGRAKNPINHNHWISLTLQYLEFSLTLPYSEKQHKLRIGFVLDCTVASSKIMITSYGSILCGTRNNINTQVQFPVPAFETAEVSKLSKQFSFVNNGKCLEENPFYGKQSEYNISLL